MAVALAPVSAFILGCALLPSAIAGASACATGSVYIFDFISQEVPINRDSHKKQRHTAVFVAVAVFVASDALAALVISTSS